MNGSHPVCKCKLDYSGINCEIMSNSLMVRKFILDTSTIIAICFLVCFAIMVLCCDLTAYFLMKKKKIQYEINHKPKIKSLHYYPHVYAYAYVYAYIMLHIF